MSQVVRWINNCAFWPRLALWSLSLHGVWEFFQCLFFYDMSGFSLLKGALWMLGATLADVVITLLLVGAALWLRTQNTRIPFSFALIVAGFLVAIGIEIVATSNGLWHYAPQMPQIHLGGITLGWLPIMQMALLPWVSARLAKAQPFTAY